MDVSARRGKPRNQLFAPPAPRKNCVGLFKFLIGDRHERIRDLDSKRLCGLEVDDQLESIRAFDRHPVRLCAAQDTPGLASDLSISFSQLWTIAHQPAVG